MPNWIYNKCTIYHSDINKINAIYSKLKNKEVLKLFNTIRPRPQDQDSNWYEWNTDMWGTKWDAHDINEWELLDDNTLYITFNTAWCPPIKLYDYMLNEKYSVNASFEEECKGPLYGTWSDGIFTELEHNENDMDCYNEEFPTVSWTMKY